MSEHVLSFKVGVSKFWDHDNSVVVFEDGDPVVAIESERVLRNKHGKDEFPTATIEFALERAGLTLADIDTVAIPYDTGFEKTRLRNKLESVQNHDVPPETRLASIRRDVDHYEKFTTELHEKLDEKLRTIGPVPEITAHAHHRCHAASAFFPAPFDEALVVTIDGMGEFDSTVVWRAEGDELERVRTYEFPNSLGMFYGLVTEYLGYRRLNGEGKVMGLAPYGEPNPDIRDALDSVVSSGVDYDVTGITGSCVEAEGVRTLERLFGREALDRGDSFTQWHKDLAYETQRFTEETVIAIVAEYLDEFDLQHVGLAGGVALNCKSNKQVMALPGVEEVYVQPAANDAGLAVGAGMLASEGSSAMDSVFLGPAYDDDAVRRYLDGIKVEYRVPDDVERYVARKLADGKLVGWFQGRMELGPRALGHRSILADPRSAASRDRVNRFVKHREEWRPFAPSMLEERADDYLVDASPAPYMTKTFDVRPEKADEIPAVLHPADDTTRPQLVSRERNPRYHRLISAFEELTGTPVVLNTSFNDSGEPIVLSPKNAIEDFFSMGLDLLVIEDTVIEK